MDDIGRSAFHLSVDKREISDLCEGIILEMSRGREILNRDFGDYPGPYRFGGENRCFPIILIPIFQHGYEMIPRPPAQVGRENRDFYDLIRTQILFRGPIPIGFFSVNT